MPDYLFIVYLIYGATFIFMGIFALLQKTNSSNQNIFIKALFFLGMFGILHGVSEWINMIILSKIYLDWQNELLIVKQLFKAISFVFLAIFGLKLIESKKSKVICYSGFGLVFFIWLLCFVQWTLDPHEVGGVFYEFYNTILLRYMLAFFSALITGIGLLQRAKAFKTMGIKQIAIKYWRLAIVFIFYAFIEGILVNEKTFFPANLINNGFFFDTFGIPVQFIKIVIGLSINFLLTDIVRTFNWEQNEMIKQLNKSQTIAEERQKMCLDIHDGIIQSLYAIGLKMEALTKQEDLNKGRNIINNIREDLNEAMVMARNFIGSNTLKSICFDELRLNINKMIDEFRKSSDILFVCNYMENPTLINKISEVKSTHLYYIIQEAIINVIKHANASQIVMDLSANDSRIVVQISDDGIGIIQDHIDSNSYGIGLMKKRVEELEGTIEYLKSDKGTKILVTIPWRECNE